MLRENTMSIHQTHAELLRPARDPLPEDGEPQIDRAIMRKHSDNSAEANSAGVGPAAATHQSQSSVYLLMKETKPRFAYQRVEASIPRQLGWGWGAIEMAAVLACEPTTGHHEEEEEEEEDATTTTPQFRLLRPQQFVAIKTIRKAAVKEHLERGGRKNPYNEILRMQQLGDNIHVLKCVEALEDDDFLYIITPFCVGGCLSDNIPWDRGCPGYPKQEAKEIFRQILQILCYLERHGICHHDISPDNFLFYNGRLVLSDFAMSLRIPTASGNGSINRRYLIKPQGPCGSFSYQAPEIFLSKGPFDGVAVDLWSAAVVLYNVLTGQTLYRLPHPSCIIFRYFLLAGALSRTPVNERTAEILRDTFHNGNNDNERHALITRTKVNLFIPQDAMELLEHLLSVDPSQRWTLGQALNSVWLRDSERGD